MRPRPCKDCPDRTMTCHFEGECDKYMSFKAECERDRQQRHEHVDLLGFVYDSKSRVIALSRTTRKHKTGGHNED